MSEKTVHQQRVEQMMNKIRELGNLTPIPSRPTVPDGKMILAQARLILEEVMELFEACDLEVGVVDPDRGLYSAITRDDIFVSEVQKRAKKPIDITEVAKELADVSVVTTGMFSEFGLADVAILEEVDANNLAKFGPGGHLDENRKWRKPPNHPKPDIKQVLVKQGWAEAN